jgi:lysophospholipid acyltransferase (LPLAT)-like uncharacterized protein
MGLLKDLSRARPTQEAIGFLMAKYLQLVRRTNRFVVEPADMDAQLVELMPAIIAMWHGQHFMVPFAKRETDRAASLVSRSSDGELNAIALRHAGIRAIRGSGARGRKVQEKGGISAMRAMLRALQDGEAVALTADVPKRSRVCGQGIVVLAQLSGRPILPVAVVTSRRLDFDSWDKASLGLPFGRGVMVWGEPVRVARDADEAALEAARQAVERSLDAVHKRAYALVGGKDPGAPPGSVKAPATERAA